MILGGDAEIYYGLIDYLPGFTSINDIVEKLLDDENLTETHSSY